MNTSQGVWKSHLFYNGDAIADSIYLQFFIEFQILIFFPIYFNAASHFSFCI